ncbi:MAG: hypothetical protein WBD47_06160 [Phormidesmis sp.]
MLLLVLSKKVTRINFLSCDRIPLRSGDWANFSLRCDEAAELCDRTLASEVFARSDKGVANPVQLLNQSIVEQREISLGLAKYKVERGDVIRAKEIADMCSIPYQEIGLTEDGEMLSARFHTHLDRTSILT